MSNLSAQILKYYTRAVSFYDTEKEEWTECEKSHSLVVINIDKGIINIYTDEIQEYDCYRSSKEIDENNNTFFKLMCVNKNGLNCIIRLYHENRQIYIDFPNFGFAVSYDLEEDYRTSE